MDLNLLILGNIMFIPSKNSINSLMFVLCFLVTGVLSKHIDHRNLFTQRMCCKRQSHFVYIGQGKAFLHQ